MKTPKIPDLADLIRDLRSRVSRLERRRVPPALTTARYECRGGESLRADFNLISLDTVVHPSRDVTPTTTADDGAVDEVTVNRSGMYLISGGCKFQTAGAGKRLFVQRNRDPDAEDALVGSAGESYSLNVATQAYLTAGDTLSLRVFSPVSDVLVPGPINFLAITRLSD